ncbi:hypothetical protein R1sor_021353 [Riccia sorocarpa]|uniref:Uncharacterized protein n=1 Tax=Riccia sorocarpa TaxID=122646 RepID=A0ABD3GJR0_9MARC
MGCPKLGQVATRPATIGSFEPVVPFCFQNGGDTTLQLPTLDIHNSADHGAGDHSTCKNLPGNRKCVIKNWSSEHQRKYAEGGETMKISMARTNRVLVDRTSVWKVQLASHVFT